MHVHKSVMLEILLGTPHLDPSNQFRLLICMVQVMFRLRTCRSVRVSSGFRFVLGRLEFAFVR